MGNINSEKQTRVLVLWADGRSPNLGVRVLGAGATSIAKEVWGPHTEVNLQDFAGTQTGVGMGIKAVIKELLSRRRKIRDFLKSHDFILDTGAGDSFTDIYGLKRMITIFIIQRWSLAEGVPVVLLPQTIGPFQSRIGRALARNQLSKLSVVMARDPKSAALAETYGRIPEVLSSDLVFALPRANARETYDILFNVSGLLWNPNNHVNYEDYRSAVKSFIQDMSLNGRRVTVLAHVVDGAVGDNDSAVIEELLNDNSLDITAVVPESLAHAREVIAGANIVVGARMHACLNALSLGVPSIPWAYSRKFEPLLNQLGWEHIVDLKTERDAALATSEILAQSSSNELNKMATQVAGAGQAALALTTDGIRKFTA